MRKLKLAIFDLTDCEGCELQFLALREKLARVGQDFQLENWRLAANSRTAGPFDVTFIEGSPISESDIEIVKQARRVSRKVITLGSCAAMGGVQSALSENTRAKNLQEIYGAGYKSKSKPPKPVSYYVEVDVHLPGCPVNPKELEKLLASLAAGKKFVPTTTSVCLDCKLAGNACLFLDEGYCLGPVTKGGCGAPCPAAGLRCYGCFGTLSDANFEALGKATPHMEAKDQKKTLELFFKNSPEYLDHTTRKRKE